MIEIEELSWKCEKVYRCPDPIENFKLRVRLKDGDREEIRVFGWQEKVYGRVERERYIDERNCHSDADLQKHRDVRRLLENDSVIFSCVHNDLNEGVQKQAKKLQPDSEKTCFDFESSFFAALENSTRTPAEYESMKIQADFGELTGGAYDAREYTLCTIRYDSLNGTMWLRPDYTIAEPYAVRVNAGDSRRIEFWLENASLDGALEEDLVRDTQVLNKVLNFERKLKSEKFGNFSVVPVGKLVAHLFLDVLTAGDFEHDNLYVRYRLDLPEGWSCPCENVEDVTPACRVKSERENVAHFGFPFEFRLETDLSHFKRDDFAAPCLYFEVVSKETFGRFRTEGLTRLRIPIEKPGTRTTKLRCFRISSGDRSGRMRRFFIGDSGLLENLAWIGAGQETGVINRCGTETISTGWLSVRLNVLHQSDCLVSERKTVNEKRNREHFLIEKLRDVDLMRSVEQVLEAFERARRGMLEARGKF